MRYGPFVKMEEVVKDASGNVTKVKVRAIIGHDKKVKGVIHWVSKEHSVGAIVNQYANLLTVANVAETSKAEGKHWTEYVNPESLIRYENARIWDLQADVKEFDRFQFERVGYFCVDKTSKTAEAGGKIVFNGIVALKDARPKN